MHFFLFFFFIFFLILGVATIAEYKGTASTIKWYIIFKVTSIAFKHKNNILTYYVYLPSSWHSTTTFKALLSQKAWWFIISSTKVVLKFFHLTLDTTTSPNKNRLTFKPTHLFKSFLTRTSLSARNLPNFTETKYLIVFSANKTPLELNSNTSEKF